MNRTLLITVTATDNYDWDVIPDKRDATDNEAKTRPHRHTNTAQPPTNTFTARNA
ncbi:hypothetical protein OK074_3732 [Actinobacteria bacterium OK074]|nr:hypothetical protein OK074_3732 [Actinobacteria bacterium OK074]